jgi:nucleotide-binding universal stress UspA family protein
VYKKILVPNDGSDGARKAFDCAVEMASCFRADLHMISVEEHLARHAQKLTGVQETKAREETNFEHLAIHCKQRAALRGVNLEGTIRHGHEVKTIVGLAREGLFDLLIVRSSGRSRAFASILGGTSENPTTTAPCLVLVVK